MKSKETYLQSPIDDLESFYNVFLWAILHNEHLQMALSARETRYKNRLSGSVESLGAAQGALLKETPIAPINNVKQLQNVMLDCQSVGQYTIPSSTEA